MSPIRRSLREALELMTRSGKQIALVVDARRALAGLVTDGDVRKALLRGVSLEAPIGENMNRRPLTGPAGLGRAEAWRSMRTRGHPAPAPGRRRRPADGRAASSTTCSRRTPLPASAVIMAGGMGTRLRPLTEDDAEAAAARGRAARSSRS